MTSQQNENAASQWSSKQRYTVHEAALLLGLSVDAVRKRAERGSLKREKDPDGTVYIILDTEHPATGRSTSQNKTDDETATSQELIHSLRDQIDYLRRELGVRNDELRRKDHLLAAALERIPELPPMSDTPSHAREPPVTASDEPGEGDKPGKEKRRSWLYRFFFGP